MSDTEAQLRKRISDLERELHVCRMAGAAQTKMLKEATGPMAEAALAHGGADALHDAVRDYTPDQGTWPAFLIKRATALQAEFERLYAAR